MSAIRDFGVRLSAVDAAAPRARLGDAPAALGPAAQRGAATADSAEGSSRAGRGWPALACLVLVLTTLAAGSLENLAALAFVARFIFAALLVWVTWQQVPDHANRATGGLSGGLSGALVLCGGAALVSSLASSPGHSARSLMQSAILWMLVLVVIGLVRGRWAAGVPTIDLRMMSSTMGLIGLTGLVLYMVGAPFTVSSASEEALEQFEGLRYQGMLRNPSATGILAALTLPLSVAAALTGRRIHWVWSAVSLATVLLSQSRTGLLAIVVAGVVVGFTAIGSLARSKAVGVAFFGLPLVGLMAYLFRGSSSFGSLTAVSGRLGNDDGGTFNHREEIWTAALEVWGRSPEFGYGYGTGPQALDEAMAQGIIRVPSSSVHNSWLQWLLETGYLGILPMALLTLFLVLLTVRPAGNPSTAACRWLVGSGVLVMFTESAVFGTGWSYAWVFWFGATAAAVGVQASPDRAPENGQTALTRTDAPMRLFD